MCAFQFGYIYTPARFSVLPFFIPDDRRAFAWDFFFFCYVWCLRELSSREQMESRGFEYRARLCGLGNSYISGLNFKVGWINWEWSDVNMRLR